MMKSSPITEQVYAQLKNLVELTGIEPVPPGYQPRNATITTQPHAYHQACESIQKNPSFRKSFCDTQEMSCIITAFLGFDLSIPNGDKKSNRKALLSKEPSVYGAVV
jgi:hypothetical protein